MNPDSHHDFPLITHHHPMNNAVTDTQRTVCACSVFKIVYTRPSGRSGARLFTAFFATV
jgi:hypothetical protein